ncbi:MAG: putative rane protein, partial [Planctomycetaceae bacterium]|nr:putative rane protein [Planctomycetaceae bacterium]
MNFARRIWRNVFPPARRAVRIWDAAPLVLFIALFSLAWIGLEWSHTVMFVRPQALIWLNLCPWIWWLSIAGYAGLGRFRALTSLLMRLTIVGLFVMLLAEPRQVQTMD